MKFPSFSAPLLSAFVLLPLIPEGVRAQANVNPDISVIPRFLMTSSDGQKLADGKREFSRPDFQFQELELAISSYLNPFSRADIVLTLPGPDIDAGKLGVEEMYATVFRGLPFDLNLRVGKYRAEFGKLNQMHPHAWPFISTPLVQQRFLGEEALNDLGISASILLPTGDVYTKLTADLLRGRAIGGTTGLVDTTGAPPLYANSARLMSFFTLTDNSDLELGLSGYTGIHDPYYHDRFWYANVDFKYKYRPDSYTSLVVQGEALFSTRTAHQDAARTLFREADGVNLERTITSNGGYLFADYQFFKTFSLGARYDWAGTPYSDDDRAHGLAVFAGYYPVEETIGVRLEYAHTTTEPTGTQVDVNTIGLQILFSLGPHKAHPF
jgi:hypothetical protein